MQYAAASVHIFTGDGKTQGDDIQGSKMGFSGLAVVAAGGIWRIFRVATCRHANCPGNVRLAFRANLTIHSRSRVATGFAALSTPDADRNKLEYYSQDSWFQYGWSKTCPCPGQKFYERKRLYRASNSPFG